MTEANCLNEADHLTQAIKDKLRWVGAGGDKAKQLDEAWVQAKEAINQIQDSLDTIEASITDAVLSRDDLSNEAKRKAAVTAAVRGDSSWQSTNKALQTAKSNLLRIEAERDTLKRQANADQASLAALGKSADLVAHSLYLYAQKHALEACHTRLRGVANHGR